MTHNKVMSQLVFLASLLLSTAVIAKGEPEIIIGKNVQVSKNLNHLVHSEVFLAADPKNANHLLGGSMVISEELNSYYVVAYASFDGGKTWQPTLEIKDYKLSGDPSCAFGPDGTAYFAVLSSNNPKSVFDVLSIYRSKDGGRNWMPPVVIPNAFHRMDREYITVDQTGGKYSGRIYISASGQMDATSGQKNIINYSFFRSLDGGDHFWGPVSRISPDKQMVWGPGNCIVLSDGTLVGIFPELKNVSWTPTFNSGENTRYDSKAGLKAIFSQDGGESLTEAVTIDNYYLAELPLWTTSAIPYLAADPGSPYFKDRLYAVWPDERSGRQEILFSYSADKGKTWSNPLVVNDDEPWDYSEPSQGPHHLMPVVAVNRDGVVGVMWYDRRENIGNLGYWVRFAASLDGGETFLPSVRVSEVQNIPGSNDKWAVLSKSSYSGKKTLKFFIHLDGFYHNSGHTAGMATNADGVFFPFWIDNRTGVSQIWTAPVFIKGSAVPYQSADLAQLDDVSEKVELEFKNGYINRSDQTIAVEARLHNISSEVILAPVKARIIKMKSDIGDPQIFNAENQTERIGAVLDFSSALDNNQLNPQEKSNFKRLIFRISKLRPLRPGKLFLIDIEAKVLGKIKKSS